MHFLKAEIESGDCVPNGIAPERHSVKSDAEQLSCCEKILAEWRQQYRLTPDRIAILSPGRRPRSCLADRGKVADFAIVDSAADWRSGKGLLFSTITAFKGLEADAVIILSSDATTQHSRFTNYVATSRAKIFWL